MEKRKYQPSGDGGTRSQPATPHHLQNPKWPVGGPKKADETPLMRKENKEKEKRNIKNNAVYGGH